MAREAHCVKGGCSQVCVHRTKRTRPPLPFEGTVWSHNLKPQLEPRQNFKRPHRVVLFREFRQTEYHLCVCILPNAGGLLNPAEELELLRRLIRKRSWQNRRRQPRGRSLHCRRRIQSNRAGSTRPVRPGSSRLTWNSWISPDGAVSAICAHHSQTPDTPS